MIKCDACDVSIKGSVGKVSAELEFLIKVYIGFLKDRHDMDFAMFMIDEIVSNAKKGAIDGKENINNVDLGEELEEIKELVKEIEKIISGGK